MATKGEDFRAEEQRKARAAKKKAKPKPTPAAKPAKAKKKGDAKPDTALIRREEARKTSPDARARKSRANSTKVRGSGGKKI